MPLLDAGGTLACFTDDRGPDAGCLTAAVRTVLDRAEAAAGDGPVQAYGELSGLRWTSAATR